jgi:hypothetical protein
VLNESIGVHEARLITLDHENMTENSFEIKLEGKIRLGHASLTWLKYVQNDI